MPFSSYSSRRTLLKSSAVTLGALLFDLHRPRKSLAQAGTRVRYEASSSEGIQMLLLFREAVRKMRDLPDHDPRSWRFQANIHGFPPTEPIEKIFDVSQSNDPAER